MLSVILLVGIGVLSVAGIYMVYNKFDDDNDIKRTITTLLAVVIVLTTIFMVYDVKTREIALGVGGQNQATLAILLGMTGGGYSPYIKESWGGTDFDDDFDFDGIKNGWDDDADNDGVLDSYEYVTRFNPFQPDLGIKKMEVRWDSDTTVTVKCYSVQDITGLQTVIKLYKNNIIVSEKEFQEITSFTFGVTPNIQYTFEAHVTGVESNYANKANNLLSYTVPVGVMGIIGQWYYDIENQLQGIIRNNPLFYAANEFSFLENLFRGSLAGIPLFVWVIIIVAIIIFLWYRARHLKGKPPILSFGRKKKPEYKPGTIKISRY